MRLGLFGCYDAAAPRLKTLLAAAAAAGIEVVALHEAPFPAGAGRLALAAAPWRGVAAFARARRRLWARRGELAGVDAVLVPYPGHALVGLARGLGKPLVFDPFLALHDTLVGDRGLAAAGSARARLYAAIDRRALAAADVVLADTPAMAAYYAAPGHHVAVVPVGAEEAVFAPVPPPAEGPCHVLFVGSMLPLHGVPAIAAAARQLVDDARLRFTLVGTGPVEAAALVAGLPNVTYRPGCDRAELPALHAGAHVVLGHFGTSAKAERVVPHKVYEGAAMGRALVARASAAMAEAFGPAVLTVPAGDGAALAAALAALAEDPSRRLALGAAARAVFVERYAAAPLGAALRAAVEQAIEVRGTR